MIYLDHAATSPLLATARQEFYRASQYSWGNPNSVHSFGIAAARELERAQRIVAYCLSCEPEQVIFTSSATESCRLAMNAMMYECGSVYISSFEHKAVSAGWDDSFRFFGINRSTSGFAHIHTGNETGEIYDLTKAFEPYTVCFSDCTVAMGKAPIDFRHRKWSYIAGGGHKFGAPIGIGVLIAKKPEVIRELFHPATPAVPLAAALAQALFFRTEHIAEFADTAGYLHDRLIDGIMEEIPDAQLNGTKYRGNEKTQSPYITSISFPNIENHALVLRMSADGLMASSGAACSSGENEPSPALLESGYSAARARSAVRFSLDYKLDPCAYEFSHDLGIDLRRDEAIIDRAVKIVAQNVRELKKLSPARDKA